MKSLLTMVAVAALGANIVTPVINQSEVTQKTFAGKEFRFNENNEEFEFHNSYDFNVGNWIFTFMLEADITGINIKDYQYFSALDPNNKSYTKTSWGDSGYYGSAFKEIQNMPLSSLLHSGRVANNAEDIWNNSSMTLFQYSASAALAWIQTFHEFGLSYYTVGNETVLQFFGLQRITTQTTFSGGGMWTNYGIGFKLG